MKKQLKKIIYNLGLITVVEKLNYKLTKIRREKENKIFLKAYPDVNLPPDFYMYETFDLNYEKFYNGGKDTAQWVANTLSKYKQLDKVRILDWGCGAGRVLRHMPDFTIDSAVYGSDYNTNYVAWCKANLKNCTVKENELTPPLEFDDNFFDVIYSISIFTHLSMEKHKQWLNELYRVSKVNAILFITTHGKAYATKLDKSDKKKFRKGILIEHDYKVEGNRLFAAYQPPKLFEELCKSSGFSVLDHLERGIKNNRPTQDVWILTKN